MSDGFHQFTDGSFGSLFGFDFPEQASVFGCSQVYDPATGTRVNVSPDTVVFPVYIGLPMGWSWSLHFCQKVLADCMMTGIRDVGLAPHLLLEKEPTPPLSLNTVICAPYVDNANLAAFSEDRTDRALVGVLAEFERKSLVFHEVVGSTSVLATVGVVLNFDERRYLQTALAFQGHYFGLLDGDCGRLSREAMSRYSWKEYGTKTEEWHIALLLYRAVQN